MPSNTPTQPTAEQIVDMLVTAEAERERWRAECEETDTEMWIPPIVTAADFIAELVEALRIAKHFTGKIREMESATDAMNAATAATYVLTKVDGLLAKWPGRTR